MYTQKLANLKAEKVKDEITQIIGDHEPPYLNSISNLNISTNDTAPKAQDRAIYRLLASPHPHHNLADHNNSALRKLRVHYGLKHALDARYPSVYPLEHTTGNGVSICDKCLESFNSDFVLQRHKFKCQFQTPPGNEIYRDCLPDGRLVSVFEVDGARAIQFCQNLCKLAKLFLKSKMLHLEVQPFLFYVYVCDGLVTGYFSKQKLYCQIDMIPPVQNVSCIVVMPFAPLNSGQFLIELSYCLVQIQRTSGRPETPLSALGERAFRRFWQQSVAEILLQMLARDLPITVAELSKRTGIFESHVVIALEDLGFAKQSSKKLKLRINKSKLQLIKQSTWTLRVDKSKILWAPMAQF